MTTNNSPHELLNVWQSQKLGAIAMSVDELRRASDKLTRRIFWRNTREYLAAVLVIVVYGYYIYQFHGVLARLGSVLIMIAALWVAYRLHTMGSSSALAPEMGAQSCVDFHRSELIRQRDLLLSIWGWYLLPFAVGLTVFLFGLLQMSLGRPGARLHYGEIAIGFGVVFAVCAGAFVFLGKINIWAARKLQRQIDALDALKQPLG